MTKQLLKPQQLHQYQRECVMHQLTHPDSMLWLQMGLGKTPITLTTIVDRMRSGQVKKTLIFGPLRVIQAVWAREAKKWEHTQHLRFSVLHGVKDKRTRALFADADIYLCNYEGMNWLAEQLDHYYLSQGKPIPFDMVVYDEVSKLKNSTTKRMKGGTRDRKDKWGTEHKIKMTGWKKMVDQFKFRTGLTGTPSSNGYMDLHGQYLAVDGGERLGEFITHYKDSYFTSDHMGWKYTPSDIGKTMIEQKISDITIKMDSVDYLDMPACKITNLLVDLPLKARKAYEEVEADMFTALENGTEVEVFSRSAVSNKCLQFCNGSPYLSSESPEFEALHDAKLDALEDILEEAGGKPVLCSYSFKADAERIMKKFKKYKPVNMTAAKSADTEMIIDKWNAGGIKLMIGHPACLHPDTLVLTERNGWTKLIDVTRDDRVHDGVEFVSHSGCSYSGYKDVIDVFGVTMTHNHKLLIGGEWKEAKDVGNSRDTKREALYEYEGDDEYLSEMLPMWGSVEDTSSECNEAQSDEANSLSPLCSRPIPQHDWNSNLEYMAGDDKPRQGSIGQELRGSWNWCVQGMVSIRKLLCRYVIDLYQPFDNRTCGREQGLFERQLHMDNSVRSASEQAHNTVVDVSGFRDSSSRIMSSNWCKQNETHHAIESGNDSRRSSTGRDEFTLREKLEAEEQSEKGCQKEHVYDLVDCGPRHRFLIKNSDGEVFISHNSMGHGVDGLQDTGSIVVWFGCNWSLELYEQMNARINRQGQTKPVSIIRIICADTVDLAVVDALERKADDQEGLKNALERYRTGITTNELEVNFF